VAPVTSASALVVIPAHDETASVGEVVRRVRAVGYPCVVVDDGSEDDTADVAERAGAQVVRMPVNVGVGGAMKCGFAYAVSHGYDRVVQVDGDLQHPPEAIPDLVAAADQGADLVIGSRFSAGYDVAGARRISMRLLANLVSRRVGTRLDDVTSGFRVISEPLLSAFSRQYPAEYLGDTVEAVLQAGASGATIVQVPVPMEPRRHGSATPAIAASGHMARLFVSMVARKPEGMAE
jgi:glycosyltransferase involved in cell wall biosynthesis